MSYLFGFLYFAVDLLAVILLVATWQHTRIQGFLMVAASVAIGLVLRWIVPLLYRFAEGDGFQMINAITQATYLAVAALSVVGFWNIYQSLKSRRGAPPPTA